MALLEGKGHDEQVLPELTVNRRTYTHPTLTSFSPLRLWHTFLNPYLGDFRVGVDRKSIHQGLWASFLLAHPLSRRTAGVAVGKGPPGISHLPHHEQCLSASAGSVCGDLWSHFSNQPLTPRLKLLAHLWAWCNTVLWLCVTPDHQTQVIRNHEEKQGR